MYFANFLHKISNRSELVTNFLSILSTQNFFSHQLWLKFSVSFNRSIRYSPNWMWNKNSWFSSKLIGNLVVTALIIHTLQVRNWSNTKTNDTTKYMKIRKNGIYPKVLKSKTSRWYHKSDVLARYLRRVYCSLMFGDVFNSYRQYFEILFSACSFLFSFASTQLVAAVRNASKRLNVKRIVFVNSQTMRWMYTRHTVTLCLCIWKQTVPFVIESKCAFERVYFHSYVVRTLVLLPFTSD